MWRHSVFIACVLALSIIFDAIHQISARSCVAQAVESVKLRSGGKVDSNEGNGLVYRVDDLSHCEACIDEIETVKKLKRNVTDNPVIKGWTVTFKSSAGSLDYNLQECEGSKGVNFWVKTSVLLSDYTAFYVE